MVQPGNNTVHTNALFGGANSTSTNTAANHQTNNAPSDPENINSSSDSDFDRSVSSWEDTIRRTHDLQHVRGDFGRVLEIGLVRVAAVVLAQTNAHVVGAVVDPAGVRRCITKVMWALEHDVLVSRQAAEDAVAESLPAGGGC
jgi:hypothetical protein